MKRALCFRHLHERLCGKIPLAKGEDDCGRQERGWEGDSDDEHMAYLGQWLKIKRKGA